MARLGGAYFISDAHLGVVCPSYEERERHLLRFLRSLNGNASTLYIVGDLFDFWIEYRHAIRPCYFNALYHLKQLIDSGTTVHYIAGNHDFALGPFLDKSLGIHIHTDHLHIVEQGKKIHLHHGDGLIRGEFGYRVLKAVLRNPVNQALYKLLHPTVGIALATFCSSSSRHILRRSCGERTLREYRARARGYLAAGSDIVVFAHTHAPELHRFGDKVYCNTGEWIRRYSYGRLVDGRMSLWEYLPDGASRQLPSTSENPGLSAS